MAKKKITFDPTAAFSAVQQQMVHDVDLSESQQIVENADLSQAEYDPMIDDGNLPYIPSTGMAQPYQQYRPPQIPTQQGFMNGNNMIPQGQPQPYQQQMYEGATQESGLDYSQASKNIGDMKGVIDTFNTVDQSTSNYNDNDVYAISVALKSLNDAIKVLKDVDYWIPTQHERYTAQLKKIGHPIVNALSVYVEKIEKLK